MCSFVRSFVCLLVCLSICLSACSPALAAGTTDSMIGYDSDDAQGTIVPMSAVDNLSMISKLWYWDGLELTTTNAIPSGAIYPFQQPYSVLWGNLPYSSESSSVNGVQFMWDFTADNILFTGFGDYTVQINGLYAALNVPRSDGSGHYGYLINGINKPVHLQIFTYDENDTIINYYSPPMSAVMPSFSGNNSSFGLKFNIPANNRKNIHRMSVYITFEFDAFVKAGIIPDLDVDSITRVGVGQFGGITFATTPTPGSGSSTTEATQDAINNVNNTVQSGFNSTIASIQGMQQGLAQLSSAVEQQTNQMITSITQNAQQLIGSVTTLQNNIRDYFGLLEDTVESQVTQINQTITQTSTEIKQSISDVGSKVEQGFVDTGQKIDKVDESVQEVKDSVDSLPAKIKNVLLELFIPPEAELTAFYDKFSALMSSKLGFIWQVIDDILLGLFRTLMDGFTDPQTTITIPAVSLPFPGASMSLWPEMTFPIIPPGLEFLATFTKRLSDVVMVLLVINRALDFRNTFFEYYTAAAPVGEQIANEYFAEQDRKAANRAYYQRRANFAKARGRR